MDTNSSGLNTNSGPNTLPYNFIKNLIDNYKNNQLVSINNDQNIDDAHSVHFDLAVLKKFIADIENETKKVLPTVTAQQLGVRMYYGAYPDTNHWSMVDGQSVPTNYAEKHTVVMVPTLKMPDEQGQILNYDFNPLNPATYNASANITASSTGTGSGSADVSTDILAQNHGGLIPPGPTKVEKF
ncbi:MULTISPECIES: hypothetical protein [Chryseobacterium]|uniref:Uncharacterized protein n=1 Tax=Chryseobacterium camelliae TaxID=1265445 RepID=A0ABU0TR44_9FLAO|nr:MULTISPECIES: hypothetical protein [Chryseobacterium]MDT3407418.1 hypothetical protein [Pseudacidovorax intermedius]MDQ1098733.1 hypothetical protein [Chryseobacterium camelliae]MDQ1102659.1 hypothetical protein [Chryseobacterium sp. SORGH_AS_1048]MDR6086087.1 hypothetical protein [Chryseobacterium sp. SORGH_AS_0909]MDR6130456.1 hypothetical protein [Chryseobacterium sp. SORGH_AS_1175]